MKYCLGVKNAFSWTKTWIRRKDKLRQLIFLASTKEYFLLVLSLKNISCFMLYAKNTFLMKKGSKWIPTENIKNSPVFVGVSILKCLIRSAPYPKEIAIIQKKLIRLLCPKFWNSKSELFMGPSSNCLSLHQSLINRPPSLYNCGSSNDMVY